MPDLEKMRVMSRGAIRGSPAVSSYQFPSKARLVSARSASPGSSRSAGLSFPRRRHTRWYMALIAFAPCFL